MPVPALAPRIIQQTQVGINQCLATCIAMALGITKLAIYDEIEEAGLDSNQSLSLEHAKRIFCRHGVLLHSDSIGRPHSAGHLFIETLPCPSPLPILQNSHAIVVDTRGSELEIFDPLGGMKEYRHYSTSSNERTVLYRPGWTQPYARYRLEDCNLKFV